MKAARNAIVCAVDMTLFLRLLAPALLLGSLLLLGERPTNPPGEAPALAAVSDDAGDRAIPCPGLIDGLPAVSLEMIRRAPGRALRMEDCAPPPEARSLSPPPAA